MKIAIFGILPFSDIIKEGFKELGHEISNINPDIVFSNDPMGYQDAIFLKDRYPNSYLILNVLDIPWHFPGIEKQFQVLIKRFFSKADRITAISFKVKKDLGKFFEKKISEEIQVIYNPTKEVYFDEKIQKDKLFLYVGRANDPIKRFNLVRDTLQKIKDGTKNLNVCGAENPGFGNYLGYVPDDELNKIYNSTKYVFLTSKAEGIGLPMIEALICGSIPITCSDNETAKEFLPADFICDPTTESIVKHIEKFNREYEVKRKLAIELGKKFKEQFDKASVARNILNVKK
ncbi:glycosyltransferase [Pelagibacteraceae bacterium]|nr:glycosyltransferase [Pelagibacteraceae bacterium]